MKMTVEVDELPPELAAELAAMGVKPKVARSKHAPIAHPKPKRTMESQGWKPSYPGEEPPF